MWHAHRKISAHNDAAGGRRVEVLERSDSRRKEDVENRQRRGNWVTGSRGAAGIGETRRRVREAGFLWWVL